MIKKDSPTPHDEMKELLEPYGSVHESGVSIDQLHLEVVGMPTLAEHYDTVLGIHNWATATSSTMPKGTCDIVVIDESKKPAAAVPEVADVTSHEEVIYNEDEVLRFKNIGGASLTLLKGGTYEKGK